MTGVRWKTERFTDVSDDDATAAAAAAADDDDDDVDGDVDTGVH